MEPFIHNQNSDIVDKDYLTESIQTPEDVEDYLQFSYCIKCGLCYSACPSVASDTSSQVLRLWPKHIAMLPTTEMMLPSQIEHCRQQTWHLEVSFCRFL